MGITKARSVEELPKLPDGDLRGKRGLELAISLSRTCSRLRPGELPPGVHKSRSREEAARLRASWHK